MGIAIIGGTGLQVIGGNERHEMPDVEHIDTHQVSTEYADSSVEIKEFKAQENRFLFLARHGEGQRIPPHLINYRANIKALKQLNVDQIIAVTAVGGIASNLGTGELVVPDQIIDYTWGRESTFFVGGSKGRRHIDFSYPYCNTLGASLLNAASVIDRKIHGGGVYACTQGPRLETAAEVRRLQSDGADVVGMTGMPESALARELGMDYAALSVVVNPAAGLSGVELSEEDIEAECKLAFIDISKLLIRCIDILDT